MFDTLKKEIEEITGLPVYCGEAQDVENCIVIKFDILEDDNIKAMARAEIYCIHEREEEVKRLSSLIKNLIINTGDTNKIKGLKMCKIIGSNPHCFLYKDKYHDMKTYSLTYRG